MYLIASTKLRKAKSELDKTRPFFNSLQGEIKRIFRTSENIENKYLNLDELSEIHDLIEQASIEEPPSTRTEGGIIKLGYNSEIDELKNATTQGKNWLIELEAKEKDKTRNKKFESWI